MKTTSLWVSLAAAGWALVASGCGPSAPSEGTQEAPGPSDTQDTPVEFPDAGNCGAQMEEIELVEVQTPPDMLIVLDRSGSMGSIDGGSDSRWDLMVNALTDLTATKEGDINFGLMLFPSDNGCGSPPGPAVAPAPLMASDISSELGDNSPGGQTPAVAALEEARDIYGSLPVNPHGRFVLFATDGSPNCYPVAPELNTVERVQDLRDDGIDTFVLGLGDGVGVNSVVLNDAAVAGGQPKASEPYYYQADSAAELQAVLDAIAGSVAVPSCSYELAELPPDPDEVTVLADGETVPRSSDDGWDYHPDESTITFFGSYCEQIESAAIESVEFIFGCPGFIE